MSWEIQQEGNIFTIIGGRGEAHKEQSYPNKEGNQMYKQFLKQFYLETGPTDTHTHAHTNTPERDGPRGLYCPFSSGGKTG